MGLSNVHRTSIIIHQNESLRQRRGDSSRAGAKNRHPCEDTASNVRPQGNPAASNLFHIVACLQEQAGVRLRVVV
jgi:hypothetical protein